MQLYSIPHYLLTIYSAWDCTQHYWGCLTQQDRFMPFVLKELTTFRKIILARGFLSGSYTDNQPLCLHKSTHWLLWTIPPFILKHFYPSLLCQPQRLPILHITSFMSFSEGSLLFSGNWVNVSWHPFPKHSLLFVISIINSLCLFNVCLAF